MLLALIKNNLPVLNIPCRRLLLKFRFAVLHYEEIVHAGTYCICNILHFQHRYVQILKQFFIALVLFAVKPPNRPAKLMW